MTDHDIHTVGETLDESVGPRDTRAVDEYVAFLESVADAEGLGDERPAEPEPEPEDGLGGGGERGVVNGHATVLWRGSNASSPRVTVCKHMAPKLDAWAKAVGNDILLKALVGCGSFQTTTKASAGTHASGGAIDINTISLTDSQRRRVETKGRAVGLLVWHRRKVTGLWTWHAHALDPGCPVLARPARAQFELFRDGFDGLVGNRPDPGDRSNARAILREFDAVRAGRLSAAATLLARPGGPDVRFPYGPGFPVPGGAGSMYGRHTPGQPLYSGTVKLDPAKHKNEGVHASGFLAATWIRGHIKRIQRCLKILDDGNFQDQTFKAVKAFQSTHGLHVDGKVGKETWKAMAATKGQ